MDMHKVLSSLFDEKKLNVLSVFLSDPKKEFYLQQVSDESKVPIATTYRIVNKLVSVEVLVCNKVSKFKVYHLNENATEVVHILNSMVFKEKFGLLDFIKQISFVTGVDSIILHGVDSDSKASLLVLGEGIESEKIKLISFEAKEKYCYNLTYMLLSREQFEQMKLLNMITGELKVMWEKK